LTKTNPIRGKRKLKSKTLLTNKRALSSNIKTIKDEKSELRKIEKKLDKLNKKLADEVVDKVAQK
jgi:hypothetical protein